jgi:periplasmic divalent cation tolerance protein
LRLVISTAPAEKADGIADRLVMERLVACASLLPGIRSVYWWKGGVERSGETLMLMKTTEELVERAIARLVELHPYDVPEAVAVELSEGHHPYLAWIDEVTFKP